MNKIKLIILKMKIILLKMTEKLKVKMKMISMMKNNIFKEIIQLMMFLIKYLKFLKLKMKK